MESRIGVSLVNRTTRRMSLTPEGELYLEHARRILGEIDELEQLLGVSKATPKGLLRVNATLGFGRSHVAPLISRFVRKLPAGRGAIAVVGQPAAADRRRVRRLHPLRRAARYARHRPAHRAEPPPAVRVPAYLARHGTPEGAATT